MMISGAEALCRDVRFGMGPSFNDGSKSSDPITDLLNAIASPHLSAIPTFHLLDVHASLRVFLTRRININKEKSNTRNFDYNHAHDTKDKNAFNNLLGSHNMRADHTVPKILQSELDYRLRASIESKTPFIERLNMHWFNYFTVSAAAGFVGMFAGAYDREAIRKNVLGNFEKMLIATTFHPAMLFYLDNRNSVGPNSLAGRGRGKRGLNENLAREILELHTLGVDGGYSQDDVIALAKALTGWTVNISENDLERQDRIGFDERYHEPGPKQVLGKVYREDGPEQARMILRDLAAHPATAHHVSSRFADHFVGIGRAAGLRRSLEQCFCETNGDLKALTRALVTHDEAWTTPPMKSCSPFEFVCATGRILSKMPDPPNIEGALKAMGQPFWRCPSPAGWSEEDGAWIAPDALKTRLDWTIDMSSRYTGALNINNIVAENFESKLSKSTIKTVLGAESPQQAMALFLMSPELQRR